MLFYTLQGLPFPVDPPGIRAEMFSAVTGMDDKTWAHLTTSREGHSAAVDVYLRAASADTGGAAAGRAWAALCGEAVLHVRARGVIARAAAPGETGGPASGTGGPAGPLLTPDAQTPSGRQAALLAEAQPREAPRADGTARLACREDDLIRAQAVAMYAAWRAENSQWLRAKRQELLGKGLVAPDDLNRFLNSPAIRALTAADLKRENVAVSRGFSRLTRDEPLPGDGRGRLWTVKFDEYDVEVKRAIPWEQVTASGGLLPESLAVETVGPGNVPFIRGSVLGELVTAAGYLAFCLLRCTPGQALSFLVTGVAPAASPVDAEWLASVADGGDGSYQSPQYEGDHSPGPTWKPSHVRLTFPLWLSADVVEYAFRRVQREKLGSENRPLKPQYVRMFYFVLRERRRLGLDKSGTEAERRRVWAEWNSLCGRGGTGPRDRSSVETDAADMPDPLADLSPEWAVDSFTYFNTTCNRVEARIFPAFF